jgi:transcriptional regulator with XRE-family HTH domain
VSLAVKLKELRLKSGKSLQEVADAIGASKAHLWELEMGKSRNPSLDLLSRLAEHYRVTVASLVGETLEDTSDEVMRMYKDLQGLNDADRALLEVIIADMKKRRSKGGTDET